MASVMSNPVTNTERSRRKRKKKSLALSINQTQNGGGQHNQNQIADNNRWRTATEQQKYSSKLLQALRHVHTTPPTASSSVPMRGRAIREAADRVLATTAKGRTRWSRAILTNRMKLKFLKAKKPKVVSPIGTSRTRKAHIVNLAHRLKAKNLPAVQKKAAILGSLVPGCRKQPLSVVLEEAGDYISALEMQVRAMTTLAELLSVAGAVSGSLPS